MSFSKTTAFLEENSLELFHFFLGSAILFRVLDDILLNRWGIHAGEIFPYRHPAFFPLYGNAILLMEWIFSVVGGVLLIIKENKRAGAILALIGVTMSLSQMLQNQKILLWIILWIVACIDLKRNIPARKFLKYQIILVYLFTALAKIFDEFVTGKTLQTMAFHQMQIRGWQSALWQPLTSLEIAKFVSMLIICFELIIPLLLFQRKQWAWMAVLILHGSLLILMKDLNSFSLSMFALTALYYCPDVTINDDDLTQPESEPG